MSTESSNVQQDSGSVVLTRLESGVAVLCLGAASERIVTLTPQRLTSFRDALLRLKEERPAGLIITGPHAEMFTAGADISIIRDVTDPRRGEQLAREGQGVFDLLETLPFPTCAAISGPCVGGGCELALACKFRIITTQRSSSIGLPEIKLGILPGFGGTQRLPRLIGLPKALDVILGGKILKPKQALKVGLVDEVLEDFNLLTQRAEAIVLGKRVPTRAQPQLTEKILTRFGFGRKFVAKQARKGILRETKGFYPAPLKALQSTLFGLERGQTEGLQFEAKELGELIVTPESKSLVNLFFLTENSKALGKSGKKGVEEVNAVVIGAGAMGAGIAGVLARYGCQVVLKDTTEKALERGINQIKGFVSKIRSLSDTEKSFIVNRVVPTTKDPVDLASASFVIEAVFEDISLKQKIFGEMAKGLNTEAIIASNTSSLSISDIASTIPHPERVIGMHFFNPVEKMPLVEVIRGKQSSDKAIILTCALAVKLGKFPIVVNDVPGFLVNRILSPYLVEAAHLLAEGYSIRDIDRSVTSFGMPMGPIRLLDEVGLDVASHVSEIMVRGYGERMKGPGFAKTLAELGRLGKKSGRGFYVFQGKESSPAPDISQLLKIAAQKSADEKAIAERLLMRLINEAVLCFDEGVAGAPSPEAAHQVDLGSVMGFGFPPFRGGLLYYADTLGTKRVYDTLSKLEQTFGPRFTPAPGIGKRVAVGKTFHQAL